jgi:hypothetical protein
MALTPGGIYQHKKGHVCCVIGTAFPLLPSQAVSLQVIAIARFTDSFQTVPIKRRDEDLVFSHSFAVPPLVVYACCGDIWVRNVDNFLDRFAHLPIVGKP